MSGTALHRRHGPAGLLVALFVVAGLVFSYGLGHGPPPRVCTEHAVTVPTAGLPAAGLPAGGPLAGGASADAGLQPAPASPGLLGLAGAALSAPAKPLPRTPLEVCLCAAVLFTFLLLVLAAVLRRRPLSRVPARTGWVLSPPPGAASTPVFPPVLEVLRL
ncbi:Uncharacterised protein [Mycobacterium tuberculosis]|nr:Uncharacterised protein [Mycobacterium tuberculosis]